MKNNIAIIGGGYWGKNLVRNFCELKRLHTLCDIDTERLKSAQKKFPDLSTTTDYKDLLGNPEIKAIVIATPAATHYSLARDVLLSNKDVFVEKPLALNYKEGEELVSLAKQKNRILMVGHILEYHPAIIKLKDLIKNGELGNIKYIYSNRLNLGKFRTEENILWSFAPHDISILLNLLEETPEIISAHGGNYLDQNITDVTITTLTFRSGVRAHLFVSWLHPYKEQKLIVIGGKRMVMFDSVNSQGRLYLYDHKIDWIERMPVPRPEDAQPLSLNGEEPLKLECEHFIECIDNGLTPRTDGKSGLNVLQILEICQKSLKEDGKLYSYDEYSENNFFAHESSVIDDNVGIGDGTKIWHFSHILGNCKIGKNCNIGQNVLIGPNVLIGDNVKIQNNVSVYEGVTLEDDVFCGPSMVFTNVVNPRSHWPRKDSIQRTLVRKGASLGANSTIVCGINIGKYAFIGAGSVVNKNVPDYGLFYGVPANLKGWMCYCGTKLELTNSQSSREAAICTLCGRKYKKVGLKVDEE